MVNILTKDYENLKQSIGDVETYFNYNVRSVDFFVLDTYAMEVIDKSERISDISFRGRSDKFGNVNDTFFNLYNRIFKKPLNTGFSSI